MSPKKIEFNNGEVVVYPKHGVGEIVKIESMEISSIKNKFKNHFSEKPGS